jgi:PEP-CTERM motif
MRFVSCLLGAVAPAIPAVEASPITYNFSVTATSGPLDGTTASGTFSYDSSSIVPGGGYNLNTGLLTALNFTWDGIFYNETTANTGFLLFDATGTLTNALFGNNCGASGCNVRIHHEEWYFESLFFGYSGDAGVFIGTSTVSLAGVPEPSTLVLLSAGLGGLGLAVLRRRHRPA